MLLISHRGNLDGSSDLENHPTRIQEVLKMGLDCEVDVWLKEGGYHLGHDEPMHHVNASLLKDKNLWCHAKNLEALQKMLEDGIHCFWHENDNCTLTSKGIIWSHPHVIPPPNSIAVKPEIKNHDIKNCYGVCSNYIIKY
tara:strand:- start:7988 stop:8407 length:420 start_codon:yes stop_codon:yes gene_type:complete